MPNSWWDYEKMYKGSRKRKLANHTYLELGTKDENSDFDTYCIRYHNTKIIEYHGPHSIVLRTGGWYTYTTKDRINRFSPARIGSERGVWYIYANGERYEFEDNVVVDSDGVPVALSPAPKTNRLKAKLDKMVSTYINGYIDSLMEQKDIPIDTKGDCWGCLMRDATEKDYNPRVQPMGFSHFFDHFKEKYYVPTILLRAVQDRHKNIGVILSMELGTIKQENRPTLLEMSLRGFFRKIKPQLLKELQNENVS